VRRVRCLVALVLVSLLGGLTPAAYADPPDATWLGGYWDDDDFDAAVDFITSAAAVLAPPVSEAQPVSASDERIEPADLLVRAFALQTLASPRAPPVSSSPSS
jgi:hypothetical protein